MTTRRRIVTALLVALPIEAGNLLLVGMMLDPGPLPAGLFPKLLAAEWVFFHFLGFRMIDTVYKLLGTEKAGLIVAFLLAYVQTAFLIFLVLAGVSLLRRRANSGWQAAQTH
jgi:hypothetical protein